MKYWLSLIICFGLQTAWAVTETVTANTLYSPVYDGSTIIKSTIKSFFIVAMVLAFWLYWNKVILPGLNGGIVQNRNLQVIEKLQIDPTTAVYLVKVGDIYETIVTSNKQILRLETGAVKALKSYKRKKSSLWILRPC